MNNLRNQQADPKPTSPGAVKGLCHLPGGLLLLALLLRLSGLLSLYPTGGTDEAVWIFRVVVPMVGGDLNPHMFEYPAGVVFTLSWLLLSGVFRIGSFLGVYTGFESFQAAVHENLWGYSVLLRLPVFLLGLAGVVVVHRLALRLEGPWVARAAAITVALSIPFAEVTCMHQVDVAATTVALVSVCLCLDVLERKESRRTLIFLGMAFGTAMNLKIPYVLVCIALPVALLLRAQRAEWIDHPGRCRRIGICILLLIGGLLTLRILRSWRLGDELVKAYPLGAAAFLFVMKNLKAASYGLVAIGAVGLLSRSARAVLNYLIEARAVKIVVPVTILTFLAWSPYYVADPIKTLGDLMIVARNIDPESTNPTSTTFHARILARSGQELMGPLLGFLGWCGILVALFRRKPEDVVVLSVPLAWFAYTGLASYSKQNLMHVFIPFLALYACMLIARLPSWWCNLALGICLVNPTIDVARLSARIFGLPGGDTRLELRRWYRTTYPRGEPLAQDPDLLIIDEKNGSIYQVPVGRRDIGRIIASGTRLIVLSGSTVSRFGLTREQVDRMRADLGRLAKRIWVVDPRPPGMVGPRIEVWEALNGRARGSP